MSSKFAKSAGPQKPPPVCRKPPPNLPPTPPQWWNSQLQAFAYYHRPQGSGDLTMNGAFRTRPDPIDFTHYGELLDSPYELQATMTPVSPDPAFAVQLRLLISGVLEYSISRSPVYPRSVQPFDLGLTHLIQLYPSEIIHIRVWW